MNNQQGKKTADSLKPTERKAIVDNLHEGGNPVRLAEEYGVHTTTIYYTHRQWVKYVKLRKYFFD